MTTHQRENSNKAQLVADDTVEECMTHTFDSELVARNFVHEQHLLQESTGETYAQSPPETLWPQAGLRTYLWRKTQGLRLGAALASLCVWAGRN
jgi:hypothetical protein